MAHIQYIGKNGGPNGDLERAKTEALQLANEVTRTKLARMRGDLVGRKEVEFVINYALTTLREHVLRLPNLVAVELRAIDRDVAHNIHHRINARARRWLEELSETLPRALAAPDFFAELNKDPETDKQTAERERKRDAANAKRRQKYAAKHKD